MRLILSSFRAALGQVFDPAFRRVLGLALVLTFTLLVALTAGFVAALEYFLSGPVDLPIIGKVTWLSDVLTWGGLFLMLILSFFLMQPVASAFTGLFLEDVAQAVEREHYPRESGRFRQSRYDMFRDGIRFLGLMILANLLALILYGMMPPLIPIIFWSVNGYLLGREYFTMVAMRHLPVDEARDMFSAYRGTLFVAGFLMSVPLSVPIVNLLIPILGAATFTHIFHRLRDQR